MNDDRLEELASLYALDLLEGAERAQFEAELGRNPELQALVRELRESASALAHTAPPAAIPASLKARVLASLEERHGAAASAASRDAIRPAIGFRQFFPWAAAAGLAVLAGWFAQRHAQSRAEAAMVREQHALVNIELQSARNHLEAERLVTQRQVTDLGAQVADFTRRLGEAQQKDLATQREQDDARQRLAETTRALAVAQERALALDRLLADSRAQVASLNRELQEQGDLANLKIATLVSMLANSPQALAVAVWNPAKQEGLLQVAGLPALGPDEDYQLWVVDPRYQDPVDGGVFTVDAARGTARLPFKAKQAVTSIDAFAVTKERKGGVTKAQGPFVLQGK